MSSSILSWQTLTAHAQQFRKARDLVFYLKVPLDSLLLWASSGGSGETARMRRLAWTFAARIGDKYQTRLTRTILQIYTYSGFCLGCGVLAAVLMAFALDNIPPSQPLSRSSRKLLTAVVRQFRTSGYQKLLVPITLYRGLSQGFIAADFNAVSSYQKDNNSLFVLVFIRIRLGYCPHQIFDPWYLDRICSTSCPE